LSLALGAAVVSLLFSVVSYKAGISGTASLTKAVEPAGVRSVTTRPPA
jgi:hypothetical protein